MAFRPLQNVRIADFTWAAVGPYGTQLLAAMGAEVIKIGSAQQLGGVPAARGSEIHQQLNHSKYTITLDLSNPLDIETVHELIAISDVVAENFRPGVMEKFGLTYDSLVKIRPDIIMISASLMGQVGPFNRYSAFAPIFSSTAGLSASTGLADGIPTELGISIDHTVGSFFAQATLLALYQRRQSGTGQYIDLAGRDVIASVIGDILLEAVHNDTNRPPSGNQDQIWAPHGVYPCQIPDTWISIAVTSDKEWHTFCAAIGHNQLLVDPNYSTLQLRRANHESLDAIITSFTRTQSSKELTVLLQAAGVPAFPSYSARDVFSDPHLRNRDFADQIASKESPLYSVVSSPWIIDGNRPGIRRAAKPIGEDNEYIIGQLLGHQYHKEDNQFGYRF